MNLIEQKLNIKDLTLEGFIANLELQIKKSKDELEIIYHKSYRGMLECYTKRCSNYHQNDKPYHWHIANTEGLVLALRLIKDTIQGERNER